MVELGFVLTSTAVGPNTARLAMAFEHYGIHAVHQSSEANATRVTTSLGEHGTLIHQVMVSPHPDRDRLLLGAAGPSADQLSSARCHIVVALLPTEEMDRAWIDRTLLRATAAVADTSDSVAARVRSGVNYFRADLFSKIVMDIEDSQEPPVELLLGVSGGTEAGGRVSFLTSGLERFGRENFLVTELQGQNEAMGFLWTMARWMIADPTKQLPSGETLGRNAGERILIQRVPSPRGDGTSVVRLDMPQPAD